MWQAKLVALGACEDALKWCRKYADTEEGFAQAWEKCDEGGWMAWLCMRVIDQYGVMEPKLFREVNPAAQVFAALMRRP